MFFLMLKAQEFNSKLKSVTSLFNVNNVESSKAGVVVNNTHLPLVCARLESRGRFTKT